MKKLFFLLLTTLYACYGYAQTTGYIRNDTVKITNATKTATLILETASKGHSWYLKDVGNGRTQFVQAEISDINQLQDSLNTKANNNNVVHLNGYTQQNVQGILAPQRISMFGGVAPDLGGISTSGVAIGSASADRARVITTYTGSVPQWSFGGDATDHNWLLSRYINGILQDSPISVGKFDGNISYGNHTSTWTDGTNPTVIQPGGIYVTSHNGSSISIGNGVSGSTLETGVISSTDSYDHRVEYRPTVDFHFMPDRSIRLGIIYPDLSVSTDVTFPTSSGTLALSNQVLSLTGGTITGDVQYNVAPVNATSLINKSYVDNAITGITWKSAVRVKTAANITLSGTQTIDGIAVVAGNRVLVNNQTDAKQNGIYVVASGAWTRAADADSGDEIATATVAVTLGTINKNTQWTNIDNYVPVIGTDNINFGQISGAGTYTNGSGIDLSGNVFSLNTAYARGLFSATSPITYNSGTGVFGIQQASGSQDGYLSSTDWGTFNGKQNPATTLGGYGITDAYTKTQIDALTTGGANPSATIGLTATNGTATTFMRSDAAPALDQSITPTWTGAHIFKSTLSIASTSTGQAFYNTTDQTTNYERVRQFWNTNTFYIASEIGGTGTLRPIFLGLNSNQGITITPAASASITGVINGTTGSIGTPGASLLGVNTNITSSIGMNNFEAITGVINQSSTAGYRGLFISLFENAIGSGNKYLIDAGTNTADKGAGTHSSKFIVDNQGNVTAGQNIVSNGRIGIGTSSPGSQLQIVNATYSTSNTFSTTGFGISQTSTTFISTTSSGIITATGINTFSLPTLAASNATTLTTASTFRIAGAPVPGTNVTITNPYAFEVVSGNSSFGGNVVPSTTNTYTLGTASLTFSNTYSNIVWTDNIKTLGSNTGFQSSTGTILGRYYGSTGNWLLQNGGTYTDDTVNRLQIGGSIKASQFRLSALNTAPSSSTDTGTLGEVRITAGYFYLCTATNTWVRSAFSSF